VCPGLTTFSVIIDYQWQGNRPAYAGKVKLGIVKSEEKCRFFCDPSGLCRIFEGILKNRG
jgi:hypothetical protein